MINKESVEEILVSLGEALRKPAKLTIVGSSAAMISGQEDRQTPDIDVWNPTSDFDVIDLRSACKASGILYNPTGDIGSNDIYIQILRPGITMFPESFETIELGRYGNLTVDMPPPSLIIATKLARGTESDLEDVAWWVSNTSLSRSDVEEAITRIPQEDNREAAMENMVFVDLAIAKRGDSCEP